MASLAARGRCRRVVGGVRQDVARDEEAGYEAGTQIAIGLDCAASEFYKYGKYHLEGEGLQLSATDFTNMLSTWVDKYPIISIEDAMHEGDWEGIVIFWDWSWLTWVGAQPAEGIYPYIALAAAIGFTWLAIDRLRSFSVAGETG